MPKLSDRVNTFTDSVIRRMTRISNQYGAINLSQGFPDFDPPKAMLDALAKVAYKGPHQYAVTWCTEFQGSPCQKAGKSNWKKDQSQYRDCGHLRWNRGNDECHDDHLQSGR